MNDTTVFPMNMIRLCIDEYDSDLKGRAYSKLLLAPLLFSGFVEMLLRMDETFDQVGYPQAFQVRRTFLKPEKLKGSVTFPTYMMEDEEIGRQYGSFWTYDVIVQSRRQSGWQGILTDPDRTFIRKFRSEMELLHCICDELDMRIPKKAEKEKKLEPIGKRMNIYEKKEDYELEMTGCIWA